MHMPNRTAKFVSAIFAGFLGGAPLSTISHSTALAADNCLSGPKDQTPQGGHWYYRLEHGTKRQCWYLREEREKLSQTATPRSPPSAKSIAPKTEASTQGSIADAHAELWPQTRIEQPNRSVAPIPAMAADATVGEDSGDAGTPDTSTQPSTIASRWPDPSETTPSINPTPNNDNPITSENSTSRTQPTSLLVADPLAAADVPSQTPTYSAKLELVALMAALALAGILGSLIFKFGSARRPRQAKVRERRGTPWEATDDDSILLSSPSEADARARRTGFVHDLDRAGDRNDRIAEFFSQLSKRAPG
jgi:hypothetical protein